MRICYLTDFFVPHYQGGGERRYYEIAKRLIKKGHTVDIVCMKIAGAKDNENIDGIPVHHIGPTIQKPPQRTLKDFAQFFLAQQKWLRTHKYDIIEGHGFSLFILPFVKYILKKPAIALVHDVSSSDNDQWFARSKISAIGEKLSVKLPFTKILTVSNGTKNQLIKKYKINEEKIKVIHNGVDLKLTDSVKQPSKEKNTIIFVGRLIPHKHVDDLLQAFSKITKKIPTAKLKIIGTGSEEEKLISLTKKLRLNNVRFLGNVKDYKNILKEIKKSRVLALPSTREGFGIVLAEANACYVPVVAYEIEGVRDVVQSGVNGILVPPQNTKTLSTALIEILTNEQTRISFGNNGRQRVEQLFTWEKTTDQIEKFYQSMIQ
ncbi:glycosyltransferase family 4 protein [Candidatus Woesearchaeota archaeon]|nr:glycosyltransferase family 4 protein [Candidatus Woesearchaeota archaeon]